MNYERLKPSDHIEKIAELIRSLTYGETIELVSELGKTAGKTVQIDKIAELIRPFSPFWKSSCRTGVGCAAEKGTRCKNTYCISKQPVRPERRTGDQVWRQLAFASGQRSPLTSPKHRKPPQHTQGRP
jgi:hypothetical protein